MTILILGLFLFLGIHSVRIFSEQSRQGFIDKHSMSAWMGLFSIVSIIGLVLIAYGYGQTRLNPVFLWHPPLFTRHIAALLMLFAMVLVVAPYVPRNHIKAKLGHPMILGVKVWAFAHLIANGRLGDVVLFGAFLAWAILDFRSARQRGSTEPAAEATATTSEVIQVEPTTTATITTIVIGIAAYLLFALVLHQYLIGISVFG
ncbi:MAG: NnrU family protein [Gammaproteobacteria bacterium]|nr:NnrU family protein [Gammaproteobacteria bacterium]